MYGQTTRTLPGPNMAKNTCIGFLQSSYILQYVCNGRHKLFRVHFSPEGTFFTTFCGRMGKSPWPYPLSRMTSVASGHKGPGFKTRRSLVVICSTRALIFQHHGICSCLVLASGRTTPFLVSKVRVTRF